jgi:hypothetical protein
MLLQLRFANVGRAFARQMQVVVDTLEYCTPEPVFNVRFPGGTKDIPAVFVGLRARDTGAAFVDPSRPATRTFIVKGGTVAKIPVPKCYVVLGVEARVAFVDAIQKAGLSGTVEAIPASVEAIFEIQIDLVSGMPRVTLTYDSLAPQRGLFSVPDEFRAQLHAKLLALRSVPVDLMMGELQTFLAAAGIGTAVNAGISASAQISTRDVPSASELAIRLQYPGGEFDRDDVAQKWIQFHKGKLDGLGTRPVTLDDDRISVEIDHDIMRPILRTAIEGMDYRRGAPKTGRKVKIIEVQKIDFGVDGSKPKIKADFELEVVDACPCGPMPLLGLPLILFGAFEKTFTDVNADITTDLTLTVGDVARGSIVERGIVLDGNTTYDIHEDEKWCCILTPAALGAIVFAPTGWGAVGGALLGFAFAIYKLATLDPKATVSTDDPAATACNYDHPHLRCDRIVRLGEATQYKLEQAVGLASGIALDASVAAAAAPREIKVEAQVGFTWNWDQDILGDACQREPKTDFFFISAEWVAARAALVVRGPVGAKLCGVVVGGPLSKYFKFGFAKGSRVEILNGWGDVEALGERGVPIYPIVENLDELPEVWSVHITARGSLAALRSGGEVTLLVVTTAGARFARFQLPPITIEDAKAIIEQRRAFAKEICKKFLFVEPDWDKLPGGRPPGPPPGPRIPLRARFGPPGEEDPRRVFGTGQSDVVARPSRVFAGSGAMGPTRVNAGPGMRIDGKGRVR